MLPRLGESATSEPRYLRYVAGRGRGERAPELGGGNVAEGGVSGADVNTSRCFVCGLFNSCVQWSVAFRIA